MAAAVGAGVQNVVHKSSATVMPRKLLIIATQLAAYLDNAPVGKSFLVTSPEDVSGRAGFGTMAHRLALVAFRGTKNSVPVFLMLQEEPGSAQPAVGEIEITADTPHGGGEIALYVAGKAYKITVVASDTATVIGDKIAAALERDLACPVVAAKRRRYGNDYGKIKRAVG
jgi:phage tail sheath gpL-like